MGTIAQKLIYLEDTKTAIGNAIAAKGGSVTGKTFRQYATEISNLPSGGGGTPIAESVDVSNYTGGTSFNLLEQITDVNWPSGITSIGNNAFYKTGVTSVTIPNSVTSIGERAFYGCSGLTSVTIPNSVTSIGDYAFCDCKGLTSVTIPNSVTSIGSGAFCRCTNLTSVNIPNSVTKINTSVFESCISLTSITIPSGVTSISNRAFYECRSLTSITIPSGVTILNNACFYGCRALQSFTCLATTPPSSNSTSFLDDTNNCPIYVPAESVETYKNNSRWSTYASRIRAIPSE